MVGHQEADTNKILKLCGKILSFCGLQCGHCCSVAMRVEAQASEQSRSQRGDDHNNDDVATVYVYVLVWYETDWLVDFTVRPFVLFLGLPPNQASNHPLTMTPLDCHFSALWLQNLFPLHYNVYGGSLTHFIKSS
jgi:hypothetical protein